jgi:hypothetical protein
VIASGFGRSRAGRALVAASLTAIAVFGLVPLAGCGKKTEEQAADRPAPGDVWHGSGFFGVNVPMLRAYAGSGRTATLDALAASMSAAGISWARIVFDQSVEQRQPGSTDWSIPDRIVGTLARHGVRTQALFVGTAGRDAATALICGSLAYPADVDAWASFVGDAVERYGRGGLFWAEHPDIPSLPIETWEIGNEENLGMFWCPAADPEQYADVYRASRSAAHSADDDAHVIVGGLAPTFAAAAGPGNLSAAEFLRRLIAAEPALAREIPAVAVHLYAPTESLVLQELRLYRQGMVSAGLGRTPIIVNEIGWHTSGPHDSRFASETERAVLIRGIVSVSRRTNCGVVAFGVHSWVTAQTDPADPEDWYGLADPATGAPNPSGLAYAAGIRVAEGQPANPAKGGLGHLCG